MIVVFGSINLDLVAARRATPAPGETIAGSLFARCPAARAPIRRSPRGAPAPRSRWPAPSATIAFADDALAGLAAAGVDLALGARVAAPTGVALIHVDAAGQNAITVDRRRQRAGAAATVPDAALGPGTTLLLQLEVPMAAVCDVARVRSAAARA